MQVCLTLSVGSVVCCDERLLVLVSHWVRGGVVLVGCSRRRGEQSVVEKGERVRRQENSRKVGESNS